MSHRSRSFSTISDKENENSFVGFEDLINPQTIISNEKENKVVKQEKSVFYALKPALLNPQKHLSSILASFEKALALCTASRDVYPFISISFNIILTDPKPKILSENVKNSLVNLSSLVSTMQALVVNMTSFPEKLLIEKSLTVISSNIQQMLTTRYNFSDQAITEPAIIRLSVEKYLTRLIKLRYSTDSDLTFNVRIGSFSKFNPKKNDVFWDTSFDEIVSHRKVKEEKDSSISIKSDTDTINSNSSNSGLKPSH